MKDMNSVPDNILKDAKDYVDEELKVPDEEIDELNAGNTWLAKLKSGERPPGSWSPRVVERPVHIMVSRRQLRGIGVNYGK